MNQTARFLQLAQAWIRLGQVEKAIKSCRGVLQRDPEQVEVEYFLLDVLMKLSRFEEALECCQRLLQRFPGDRPLQLRHQLCFQSWEQSQLPDQPGGKLCLFDQKRIPSQRSGWAYALDGLRSLHHRRGVRFDGFIENNFSWRYAHEGFDPASKMVRLGRTGWDEEEVTSEELGVVPYRQPWVGFWHNPHEMPAGFHDYSTPQAILQRRSWLESAPYCQGLFTLSKRLAHWLRQRTGLPVVALIHPTEIPSKIFDLERFHSNRQPKIVQVGWWLRRLTSIYRLPVHHHYQKVWLVTTPFPNARSHFLSLMEREGGRPDCPNTMEVTQLSNDDYDALLEQNLVFLDLYDSSANCAIIECIARATPVLVNPLEAVREYLGEDYPFYFKSLEEAAQKAMDFDRVAQTHRYLLQLPLRQRLHHQHFCQELRQSSIYQSLVAPGD